MIKVYIVLSTFQGCPSDVKAYLNEVDAHKEAARLRRELGIRKGQEAESENAVEIKPVEVYGT
jgi:hypothetical protein